MHTVGFVNRFGSFPAPVVLVVRSGEKMFFIFPSGQIREFPTVVFGESIRNNFQFYPVFETRGYAIGQIGFAFGERDVFIGTKNEILEAIELACEKSSSERVRAKLAAFADTLRTKGYFDEHPQ